MNQPMPPSLCTFSHSRTASDFLVEIGLLYNWIMVNHYSLVLSLGGLHNQDVIIERVRECSPTILLVLPDQETVLRFVALFWEWVRQRAIEREKQTKRETERKKEGGEAKWTEEVHFPCHMPAVHPAESQASWPLRFYRCRNVSRACIFNLASKSTDQNSGVHSFVSRFAHETGCCFSLNPTHTPLRDGAGALSATSSTQHSDLCLQHSIIKRVWLEPVMNSYIRHLWRDPSDTSTRSQCNYATHYKADREAL